MSMSHEFGITLHRYPTTGVVIATFLFLFASESAKDRT